MFGTHGVRAWLVAAQRLGHDPVQLLHGSGVAWDRIAGLHPIDPQILAGLIDLVALRMPEGFGVALGLQGRMRDLGMVGYMLMNCATLGQAFELLERYAPVLNEPVSCRVQARQDNWHLILAQGITLSERGQRFYAEYMAASLIASLRDLTHARFGGWAVAWPFPEPKDRTCYDALQLREMTFDAGGITISGPRRDLDHILELHDAELLRICKMNCDRARAIQKQSASIYDRVQITLSTSERLLSAGEMAKVLNISLGDLHRALLTEGRSYQQVIDSYRQQEAQRLSHGGMHTAKEIAWRLGFNHPSSLRRALRPHAPAGGGRARLETR